MKTANSSPHFMNEPIKTKGIWDTLGHPPESELLGLEL
jgi:hypothetical protein